MTWDRWEKRREFSNRDCSICWVFCWCFDDRCLICSLNSWVQVKEQGTHQNRLWLKQIIKEAKYCQFLRLTWVFVRNENLNGSLQVVVEHANASSALVFSVFFESFHQFTPFIPFANFCQVVSSIFRIWLLKFDQKCPGHWFELTGHSCWWFGFLESVRMSSALCILFGNLWLKRGRKNKIWMEAFDRFTCQNRLYSVIFINFPARFVKTRIGHLVRFNPISNTKHLVSN